MSPKITHATPHSTPHNSQALTLEQWDVPCLNCGRFGTIPGQMITDPFNNTFCSPDCGWSHLLRPIDSDRNRSKTATHASRAAPRQHRQSRRSSRSSRHGQTAQQEQLRQHRHRHRTHLQEHLTSGVEFSRASQDSSSNSTSTSARRPPRVPVKESRRLESWERAAKECQYSGNAMFEFSMMGGLEME